MASLEQRQRRSRLRKTFQLDNRRAILGDADGVVFEPGQGDRVRIRYTASVNKSSSLTYPTTVKFDINISAQADTPVLVGYDIEGEYAVLKVDTKTIKKQGGNPLKAVQNNNEGNGDVDLNMALPLRSQPVGAGEPLSVSVIKWRYVEDGTLHDFPGEKIDLTSSLPGTTDEWGLAGLFLKTDDTVEIVLSTPKSISDPITDDDIQECLNGRSTGAKPIACWRLKNGMTRIADTDKWEDFRQWINVADTAGGGGGVTEIIGVSPILVDSTDPAAPEISLDIVPANLGGLGTDASAFSGLLKFIAGIASVVSAPAGAVVGDTDTQTLTNKTLTAPAINGGAINNASVGVTTPAAGYFSALRLYIGSFFAIFTHANTADRTYTLPDATTTLVGTDTTQTVTNKTFNSSDIGGTTPGIGYFSALRLKIGGFFAIFTHANSADRTYTLPNYNGTLATVAGAENLTNKTLTAPTINNGYIDGTQLGLVTPPFGTMSNLEITGLLDIDAGSLRIPVGTSAPSGTQGNLSFNQNNGAVSFYDGIRERGINPLGYLPYAEPMGWYTQAVYATAAAIASGTVVIFPVMIPAEMLLYSVSVFNRDTATQRTWAWSLYLDAFNNSNTLARIAASNGVDTFTPSAISTRTLAVASAPVNLLPGLYWLAFQNQHATNTFGLASDATASNAAWTAKKTSKAKLSMPSLGSTLDIVTATWVELTTQYAIRMNGSAANSGASYFTP